MNKNNGVYCDGIKHSKIPDTESILFCSNCSCVFKGSQYINPNIHGECIINSKIPVPHVVYKDYSKDDERE